MVKYIYQLSLLYSFFILHVQSTHVKRGQEQQTRVLTAAAEEQSYISKLLSSMDSGLPIDSYTSHTFVSSSAAISTTPPFYILKPLSSIDSSSPLSSFIFHTFGSETTIVKPLSTVCSSLPLESYISHTYGSEGAIHAAQYRPSPSMAMSPAQMIQQAQQQKNNPPQKLSRSIMPAAAIPSNVIAKQVAIADPNEARMRPCYRQNRKVSFSNYWIPKENEWDETNNGKRVFLAGNVKMKLMDKNNQVLGLVPVDMYAKCKMEGTCLLENGDLINIDNNTESFIRVGRKGREHNVFGLGSGSQNLVPFVSVAANDIPLGQTLYIQQLDGQDLGFGQKHNGCVRVDDDSWSFDGCQIDFFVLSYVDYLWLDLDDKISIKYANCQVKNYITKYHLAYVKGTSNEKIIPSLLNAKYVH